MRLGRECYRRLILVCGVVIVSVALVLALGVIGPVTAEVDRGGTPEKAVLAFWFNIGFNLISAVALFSMAIPPRIPGRISKSVPVIVGFIVVFLGFALVDAGSAYRSHGPAMQTASVLLFICAAADILAGIVVVATALLPAKAD